MGSNKLSQAEFNRVVNENTYLKKQLDKYKNSRIRGYIFLGTFLAGLVLLYFPQLKIAGTTMTFISLGVMISAFK